MSVYDTSPHALTEKVFERPRVLARVRAPNAPVVPR